MLLIMGGGVGSKGGPARARAMTKEDGDLLECAGVRRSGVAM